MAATGNSNTDVDIGKFIKTYGEEGFVDLVTGVKIVMETERLPDATLKRRISG